jgi:hypothetical protein
VSSDQTEILRDIIALHCPDGFDADITYGNGVFYRDIPEPEHKFDINPQLPGVVEASSSSLPLSDGALRSVVFDPPFLTYIRQDRVGNGNMIMAKRFAGYWSYPELEKHYKDTLKEVSRVLCDDGILVFKCQDIIHNHKMHCTHANVIQWAGEVGMRIKDIFILTANHRLPSPNRKGVQRHARIFHSYFLVFKKNK